MIIKDFCKTIKSSFSTIYLNESGLFHRLDGAAIEYLDKYFTYYLNEIKYMEYHKGSNQLFISPYILDIPTEYYIYIKNNINILIKEYCPKIDISKLSKKHFNKLPNFIKDLLIL